MNRLLETGYTGNSQGYLAALLAEMKLSFDQLEKSYGRYADSWQRRGYRIDRNDPDRQWAEGIQGIFEPFAENFLRNFPPRAVYEAVGRVWDFPKQVEDYDAFEMTERAVRNMLIGEAEIDNAGWCDERAVGFLKEHYSWLTYENGNFCLPYALSVKNGMTFCFETEKKLIQTDSEAAKVIAAVGERLMRVLDRMNGAEIETGLISSDREKKALAGCEWLGGREVSVMRPDAAYDCIDACVKNKITGIDKKRYLFVTDGTVRDPNGYLYGLVQKIRQRQCDEKGIYILAGFQADRNRPDDDGMMKLSGGKLYGMYGEFPCSIRLYRLLSEKKSAGRR